VAKTSRIVVNKANFVQLHENGTVLDLKFLTILDIISNDSATTEEYALKAKNAIEQTEVSVYGFVPFSEHKSDRACLRGDSVSSTSVSATEHPTTLSCGVTGHFAYETVGLLLGQSTYWISRILYTYTVIPCTARLA